MAARYRIAAAFLLASLPFAEGALAADPTSLARHRDWQAYEATEDGKKVCYALTAPQKSEGDYTNRGPAFVMVTRRPAENVYDDVSAIAGYSYKPGDAPEFRVGSKSYAAEPVNDVAWPKSGDVRNLVAAMKAGSTLELIGTSSRGTKTRDEFSLLGFTAALEAITQACPKR